MLLRALMFRLAVHALHPRSTAESFPGLARTAALVRLVLQARPGTRKRTSLRATLPSTARTPRREAVPAGGWSVRRGGPTR